jgi:aminobenzoyl-glutamate utilization protein B
MILAGLFEGVDAVLGSHISDSFNTAYGTRGTGLVSTQFTFHGRSSHAAVEPWLGRSALDAVELMDIGWNFRREHLPLDHRSHYVIVEGGDQPNVIPDRATVWYYFRGMNFEEIRAIYEIGQRVAQGAAMMTGTTVKERVLSATWPRYFNKPLAEALYANIKRVGMPEWSEADETLARAAQRELGEPEQGMDKNLGPLKKDSPGGGSDDIGDVSWNVPTVVLRFPGNMPGMIMHHWSSGISMATPIAHKGATAGAKAQALTALDILHDPELVRAAHAFLSEQTKRRPWEPLVPENTLPPTFLNEKKMGEFRPEMKKFYYDPERFDTYLDQLDITYPTTR